MAEDDNDIEQPEGLYDAENANLRERKLSAKQILLRREAVMAGLLETRDGREFLAWVLHDLCGIANPSTPEVLQLAHYQAGARGIGLTLQKQALQSAPRLYMVLMTEHANKF